MSTRANRGKQQWAAHTPTHSFSEGISVATPDSTAKVVGYRDVVSREEYENAKARLSDQKFRIRDFDDPLLPRTIPKEKHYPPGTNKELESHLLNVIAKVKDQQAKQI